MRRVDQDRQTAMKILLLYSLFAAIATALNLISQELSLAIYGGPLSLYAAILAGTGTGLVSKYFLDKLFIFKFQVHSWNDDLNRFIAYSVTGVFTTLIFWGFELSFEWIFATKQARYIGAVIGLSIGYLLKYQLDKRYVFSDRVV
jgi:putative flippase GtrA